ncbi:MAG: Jag N-terminal domain-containing protein [Elusimicrobiales bacterium]|nr:Jag N-terminal domain-containing protein [Elusimicrobiales bacterium]
MKELKIEAKTVKEAIEKGLKELNLTREQVEVEIVQEEKKGILGINLQNACVIIREKNFNRADEPKQYKTNEKELILSNYSSFIKTENVIEDVKKLVSEILSLSKIDFKITKELYDETSKLVYLSLQSKDAGLLLYDGAKGLLSLQQIVSIIINKYYDEKITIKIDSEEFWQKTELKFKKDIEHAIEFINRTNKPYRMRPMPSPFRKMIHDIVKINYPEYTTYSIGKGKFRRVVIRQNKQKKENDDLNNLSQNIQKETNNQSEQNVSNN